MIDYSNKVQSLRLETIISVWAIKIVLPHPTQSIAPDQALHEDSLANEQFVAIRVTPYQTNLSKV